MRDIYIGIDLAWGEKNHSGFCVLTPHNNKLQIIDIKLLFSLDEIVDEINKYLTCKVYIGIDAALVIPNETGNREIEKAFNKDFSPYKIAMLPINRTLLTKYSPTIRSEVLYAKLADIGFKREYSSDKVIFEVYTHSTIGVCFNNNQILKYKRKKGRDTAFIKTQLLKYKDFLLHVIEADTFFETDIALLKGQKIKDYEDKLDAITCAYSLYYCKENSCKFYQVEGVDTLITPIPLQYEEL